MNLVKIVDYKAVAGMIFLLFFLLKEMLLNDLKSRTCVCIFLSMYYENDFITNFFADQSLKKIPGVPCWNGNYG